jgi:hypothetical protein
VSYIYLASPYSINAPTTSKEGRELRELRYREALRYTAEWSKEGQVIFSPIVHSHPMSWYHDMPGTWDFWSKIDYVFIDQCEKVRVLCMPDWDKSIGITAELEYAKKIGKPIEYSNYVPTNQS